MPSRLHPSTSTPADEPAGAPGRSLPGLQPDGFGERPVHKVRPFARAEDREVAGFCAAALAFGRVASVLNSIDTLFALVGPRPADFVRGFDPDDPPAGMRAHGPPLDQGRRSRRAALDTQADAGTVRIDREFLPRRAIATTHEDVGPALDSFSTRALALDIRRAYGRRAAAPGRVLFLPSPFGRERVQAPEPLSAMDGPYVTKSISARGRRLPACQADRSARHPRHQARSLSAADALRQPRMEDGCRHHTRRCARLDPDDPVRFDFSLCHVGMMNACGFGRKQGDSQCPLRGLCRPRARAPRR